MPSRTWEASARQSRPRLPPLALTPMVGVEQVDLVESPLMLPMEELLVLVAGHLR